MKIKCFTCMKCGVYHSINTKGLRCLKCYGPLEIKYFWTKINWKEIKQKEFNHWKYAPLLPNIRKKITLGEGGTPIIKFENSYIKLESLNPTGSFKDRGSTLEISIAKLKKAKKIICASTGNMGASVAAYSARANISCEIVVPKCATGEKINQIKRYGAKVIRINGDYTLAAKTAWNRHNKLKEYLVGDYAYRGEGEKTVALELFEQFNGQIPPIICPIGNGTLFSGMWKALKELKTIGLLKKLPKMIGVQAKNCKPVADAFIKKENIKPVKPKTIATAIACGSPMDGIKAINALYESKGAVVTLTEKEILSSRRELATKGIDAEPSGAISYAAYKKIKKPKSVMIITGNGLKDQKHT